MPMTFKTDPSEDLTIFTVTGDVGFAELVNAHNSYGAAGLTRFEIYDLRNGTLGSFTSEQMDKLAIVGKASIGLRPKRCKTALVVSEDVDFGMGRVYQALSEMAGVTWGTEVFRSVDEAYDWLDVPQEKSGD